MARRTIHTTIDIEAPAARVWDVLTDWEAYGEWNPLVRSISGELRKGSRIRIALAAGSGERPLTAKIDAKIVQLDEGHVFAWKGHAPIRGLFAGRHAFEVEADGDARCRFVHYEDFEGLLVGPSMRLLGSRLRDAFVGMNEALKRRVETLA